MNQNMTQKRASSALLCTAQIQRQNEQITTKPMQQNDRKRKQTDDTDSRNGQNEVQIKYTTTRTCEIQTIEPNRTQNGDNRGQNGREFGSNMTRIGRKTTDKDDADINNNTMATTQPIGQQDYILLIVKNIYIYKLKS